MNNMEIKVSVKDIPEVIEQLEIADKKINDLQQENKQLKKLCNKYEEEHKKEFNTWLQEQKVLADLEDTLEEKLKSINYLRETLQEDVKVLNPDIDGLEMAYKDIQKVIKELKEKYK